MAGLVGELAKRRRIAKAAQRGRRSTWSSLAERPAPEAHRGVALEVADHAVLVADAARDDAERLVDAVPELARSCLPSSASRHDERRSQKRTVTSVSRGRRPRRCPARSGRPDLAGEEPRELGLAVLEVATWRKAPKISATSSANFRSLLSTLALVRSAQVTAGGQFRRDIERRRGSGSSGSGTQSDQSSPGLTVNSGRRSPLCQRCITLCRRREDGVPDQPTARGNSRSPSSTTGAGSSGPRPRVRPTVCVQAPRRPPRASRGIPLSKTLDDPSLEVGVARRVADDRRQAASTSRRCSASVYGASPAPAGCTSARRRGSGRSPIAAVTISWIGREVSPMTKSRRRRRKVVTGLAYERRWRSSPRGPSGREPALCQVRVAWSLEINGSQGTHQSLGVACGRASPRRPAGAGHCCFGSLPASDETQASAIRCTRRSVQNRHPQNAEIRRPAVANATRLMCISL